MEELLQYYGGGFENIFPEENIPLFEKIVASDGLVISEYLPEVEANSKHFPIRNRIISGISIGVLVTQAGYRSGASLTANIARTQSRKVFCIPASIDNKHNRTNELIQEGAKLVCDANDILREFSDIIPIVKPVGENSPINRLCPKHFSRTQKCVRNII